MKKEKQLIYLKTNPVEREYICMGISVYDIWKAIKATNTDIILIKSDELGDECINNFEIICEDNIDSFLSKYRYGDLCFMDCNNREKMCELNDNEIAEMLFIGHMNRPLNSPFVKKIGNRIVYIGHDNDYFCKLYCVNNNDFYNVLNIKIQSYIHKKYKANIRLEYSFIEECIKGLLIDLDDIYINNKNVVMPYYIIGFFNNMDKIINRSEVLKQDSLQKVISWSY